MPEPLQVGDPGELGPFRLESRLHESPAGIVYLGTDRQGRSVEVALLTSAAAGDAAARDRFRAAVSAELPRPMGRPAAPPVPSPGEPSPVLAAYTEGAAPWVATAYEDGRSGAERFLEPVMLRRGWGMRRRRGPQFQPYWLSQQAGLRTPALGAPGGSDARAVSDSRGLAMAVVSLAALLVLLAVLVGVLFACEPTDPSNRPPIQVPTQQPTLPPTPPPGSGRPTQRPSATVSPQPAPSGPQDTINPAGTARPVDKALGAARRGEGTR
jgi:hypothetical protein